MPADRVASETNWHLWIDESGDFDNLDDPVVVAGLLIRADSGGAAERAIEAALAEAAPGIPWPLHATLVNELCMVVLWPVFEAERSGRPLTGVAAQGWRLLTGMTPQAAERALEAMRAGQEPRYEDRRTLSRRLERSGLVGALGALRRQLRARVGGVIEAAAQRAGAEGAWGLVAAEGERGDAAGRPLDDRYLNLLAVLLQRAQDVLLRLPGHHRLWILAAQRHVKPFAGGRPVSLRRTHVAWASVAAAWASDLTVRRGDRAVTLHPWRVFDYRHEAPPGLVIADWIANRARRPCDKDRPIAPLVQALGDGLGIPWEISGLPTPAASGEPWRYLRAARRGLPAPVPSQGRVWTREQAQAWAQARGFGQGEPR